MNEVIANFSKLTFNDKVMKERLPKDVYDALKKTIDEGKPLDLSIANEVAAAMKDWAIENGATHFTHWFQPLTGVTAEKHDSFLSFTKSGDIIMDFSGSELIKGESDASSFPSGGLRATFEARGYTAWDPTSYAFIKDKTLCIPTAFCSFGGESLDLKSPLLRSMDALNVQTLRILKLFGKECRRVFPNVGAEQEYFLVDREIYNRRKDLLFTGRTLFGAKPPKGQELDDHYYGSIKIRVSAYMKELDEELWKVGILAKTEHNEVAPAQHEIAPMFSRANLACDQNQAMMEIMRKVAKRHGLTCLLHERPFAGVNGSGKHVNWSISTDDGTNLFAPGDTPESNAQFLLFLCAVIKAVNLHQDLLRISVCSAGNDHRLGGNEAPPAVVSIFLGDELQSILEAIETGKNYDKREKVEINIGVDALPRIPRDSTDRNRTSPFAFTGNKFEFRMPGAAQNISTPVTMLNTALTNVLDEFAGILENAENFNESLNKLIRDTIRENKRIIFNGNGYGENWEKEAENRGLLSFKSTPEAVPHLKDQKNLELFAKYGIFTPTEVKSRCGILLENYVKQVNIETLTMLEMVRSDIQPAAIACCRELSESLIAKHAAGADLPCKAETELLKRVSTLSDRLYDATCSLDEAHKRSENISDIEEKALFYRREIITRMNILREAADELETIVSKALWPFPSYGRMLYVV
ncbi:MAG: glutamine synthetase III [Oscillospiraceae bacterium]|nr:glutamine synthetase III [Oscillospiraceae bacterium]